MGEKKWTDEQLLAINTTDKTLLISAAAGSGKTATLTERIIRSILNKDSPMDIRRMLIVTFTNAAVEELRQRITGAIKSAMEKDPQNSILAEQMLAVKGARIMTIDAFCNSVVKATAEEVGLQPNYRIAEGAEEELLLSRIMDDMISSAYDGKLPEVADAEAFASVAECLTTTRGESELAEVFRSIYRKTETIPAGTDALNRFTDEFDPNKFSTVEESRYGKYVIEKAKTAAGVKIIIDRRNRRLASETPDKTNSYIEVINPPMTETAILSDSLSEKSLHPAPEATARSKTVTVTAAASTSPSAPKLNEPTTAPSNADHTPDGRTEMKAIPNGRAPNTV
jgi:ATP-dependent helicase/nuclease subunit A